jgi:outer membrane protein assembly factor BamB
MKMRWRLTAAAVTAAAVATAAVAADWPGWRGPTGDGRCRGTDVPLKWTTTENVRWKAPLRDEGNSSPVVWRNRVFVTQALEKGKRRAVLCFDRADGKKLWQSEVRFDGTEPTHPTNPYCSATPVTDGERVIASFGSAGLVCYDFAGKLLWHKDVGKMIHVWGNASSPVLYGDFVILWCGPGERQVLFAADKKTGETVWEYYVSGGNAGKDQTKWVGSWATPVVAKVNGHDELILPVPNKVLALDPRSGDELWSCDGLGPLVYASPVVSADGIVVAVSGFHGPDLAVRAGGTGDVTATRRLWRHEAKIPQRIGSPVIVGNLVYLLSENGLAQCFDLRTGEDRWGKERASGESWGSLVAIAGRLYVTTLSGETVVLAAKPAFAVLARNRLDERTLASPAVSDGDIFVRTYQHLWCIGAPK